MGNLSTFCSIFAVDLILQTNLKIKSRFFFLMFFKKGKIKIITEMN